MSLKFNQCNVYYIWINAEKAVGGFKFKVVPDKHAHGSTQTQTTGHTDKQTATGYNIIGHDAGNEKKEGH